VLSVKKLLASRRVRSLRLTDLPKLRVNVSKVMPFVVLADHRPSSGTAVFAASGVQPAAPSPPQPPPPPSINRPASAQPVQFSLAWE
jgi:hypothetical protein